LILTFQNNELFKKSDTENKEIGGEHALEEKLRILKMLLQ